MRVPAAGEDKKFAVFGALDYAGGRLTWQTRPTKDSIAFLQFLDALADAFPTGQVAVVLDNVGYHKSRPVRAWWVAHNDRFRPTWLPADAIELNVIERVWRYLKDKLSCHRWWADLAALEAATITLLDHIEARFHHRDDITLRPVQNSGAIA
jgi:putative transposase